MPKQLIQDNLWRDRIDAADRYYKTWEQRFKCDILDQYYEGFQWADQGSSGYNPYVINKIYETIQIKIATFIPTFPKYVVSSRPGNEESMEAASVSANLKMDLLNTIAQDFGQHFSPELEMVFKDSFLRFGIAEVGYAADWIINPNAPKPLLSKDTDATKSGEAARRVKQEPPEIPQNERVYIKHIPAKTFRIGGLDNKYLNRCGWCGYYDYVHRDDLLALPKIMNRDKLNTSYGEYSEEGKGLTVGEPFRKDAMKIWRIWDLRSMMRLIIVDSPCVTVFQRKFQRLPLFDLRPDPSLITNGFYPIPPAYQWLSPQDEYNDIRESLRNHRKRFVRKFQVQEGMVDDEEIEKFELGPDGGLVKVKRAEAITPIQNATMGPEIRDEAQLSSLDLHEISGTSSEARGVADRTTATQATIVNQRAGIRENKERDRVVKLFCEVGREILLTIADNFTGGTVVRLSSPEGESFGGAVQGQNGIVQAWRFIEAADLRDGYDFRIDVDLSTMSVSAQQEEKQHLFEFTAFLQQNPYVAFSPYLVRESAMRIGYRNEKAIAEFQQMALLMELARMNTLKMQVMASEAALSGGLGMPNNGNQPQQMMQQATPPAQEQIRQQLVNQQNQPQLGSVPFG